MCVCSRLVFCSKCTGFTVCFPYSNISLSMYINHTLTAICFRPFASKAFFLAILKDFDFAVYSFFTGPFNLDFNISVYDRLISVCSGVFQGIFLFLATSLDRQVRESINF